MDRIQFHAHVKVFVLRAFAIYLLSFMLACYFINWSLQNKETPLECQTNWIQIRPD